MKKLNVVSKRVALVASFLVCGLLANAQNQTWQTSKDVQKVANKDMFADEDLKKSHVNAESLGTPTWVFSKGVSSVSNKNVASSEIGQGNIASTGYPTWTISKGVARMNNSDVIRKANDEQVAPSDPASLTVSDKKVKNKKRK